MFPIRLRRGGEGRDLGVGRQTGKLRYVVFRGAGDLFIGDIGRQHHGGEQPRGFPRRGGAQLARGARQITLNRPVRQAKQIRLLLGAVELGHQGKTLAFPGRELGDVRIGLHTGGVRRERLDLVNLSAKAWLWRRRLLNRDGTAALASAAVEQAIGLVVQLLDQGRCAAGRKR